MRRTTAELSSLVMSSILIMIREYLHASEEGERQPSPSTAPQANRDAAGYSQEYEEIERSGFIFIPKPGFGQIGQYGLSKWHFFN